MKAIIRKHFAAEIHNAKAAIESGNFADAWTALQRAHILGQAYPLLHVFAHWEMLKLGWKQRDAKEVLGQFIPTILALPLTLLFRQKRSLRDGKVNVNNSKRIAIPEDLLQILNQ